MNTQPRALVLAGIVGSLSVPGCVLDVLDLNNPELAQLETSPTASGIAGAATGLLIGNRSAKTTDTGLINQLGILGREALDFEPSDTRFISELIQGKLSGASPFGGSFWSGPYANIRLGNIILHGVDKVPEFTEENKAAVKGFTHTIQALELLTVIITHDIAGAVIDVDHPLGDPLGPIVDKSAVLAEIVRLLDVAATELAAGGTVFPFALSAGHVGFDQPATFLEFNRGIRARVAVYQTPKDYAAALTALAASFLDDTSATIDFKRGVYYAFSLQPGDATNGLINLNIYAHPGLQSDAQQTNTTVDARFTSKTRMATDAGKSGIDDTLTSQLQFTLYPSNESPAPLIRNEELILLKAEALYFTNDKAGALAELNLVRTRSGGLAALAAPEALADDNAFVDALLYERRYSLMYEGGHRWIDLRRFDRPLPLDSPDHVRNLRYPIPLAECDGRPDEPACLINSAD